MVQLGIETGSTSEGFLQQHFGKAGSYYCWAARGIDERYQAGECRNYRAHFSLHRGQVARMVRGNG